MIFQSKEAVGNQRAKRVGQEWREGREGFARPYRIDLINSWYLLSSSSQQFDYIQIESTLKFDALKTRRIKKKRKKKKLHYRNPHRGRNCCQRKRKLKLYDFVARAICAPRRAARRGGSGEGRRASVVLFFVVRKIRGKWNWMLTYYVRYEMHVYLFSPFFASFLLIFLTSHTCVHHI